jgi:hypothetical protein
MRRLCALVLFGACGTPEQVLRVSGQVSGSFTADAGFALALQHDEGATASGCGTFATVQTFGATEPRYDFDLLRASVVGPRGTPRCMRLDFEGPDGSHSQLTWLPTDHDVELPTFQVWPLGTDYFANGLRESDGRVIARRLPDSYVTGTSETADVLPARSVVDVLDDRGERAWRLDAPIVSFPPGSSDFGVVVDGLLLEDRPGAVQVVGVVVGRQFDYDPLGRAIEVRFEYRAKSAPAPVRFAPVVPLSRGASCGDGACPFTDGDFTPVPVGDAGVVTVALAAPRFVSTILVRGLETEARFARLELGIFSQDAGTAVVSLPVPEELQALSRDGLSKGPRLDVRVFTGRLVETVTVSLVDGADAGAPLGRLGELSLFE